MHWTNLNLGCGFLVRPLAVSFLGRALPVGVALFLGNGEGWMSTPDPRQDGNSFVRTEVIGV
ncbi:MAG: hypothetical protein ACE362_10295 [Phaeodactylibacter xiamenensis]|uniref:hypothetical protein n=1 Tax=Phaeodactylibacter xiamenensis TaxID=1524460 RepID=UPI00126A501A|nr:hypothetical protein [Phaeodactylibacter xiamenensis]MCR9050742.1 hypothetical protein [bacterium]